MAGEDRELTEGEQWAREQLSALLARRFTPAAIARFLWSSWRRSAQIRRERPELARRSWLWLAIGAAAYLPRPERRGALAWWGLTAVMLDWHLGMFETEAGEPRNLGPADALTMARAWLVPVAHAAPTPAVVLAAAGTDVLDGIAARASHPTRAGRDLEGLVDACFGAAALRGAIRAGHLSPVAGKAELARLAAGFLFALGVYFGRAQPPPGDLVHAARATTTLRVGGLVMAGLGHRRTGDALLLAGCAASVALLARALTRGAD